MTLRVDPEQLVLRPIEADDAERLVAFHEALDAESQYRRFFSVHPHLLPDEVERFTHVDHRDREAFVVVDGDRIVAVGRYDRLEADPGTADIAFVVAVEWRNHGLASWLLRKLAEHARANGIESFVAETLLVNQPMRAVFADSGFPSTNRFDEGVVQTWLDIASRIPEEE